MPAPLPPIPRPQQIPFSDNTGAVWRYAAWAAPGLLPRHVDVWLPPEYATDPGRRFPVLYMHDGQNLFDPALCLTTGVDWGVDEALLTLTRAGRVPPTIVVGLWNTMERRRDYLPEKPVRAPQATAALAAFVAENGGEPQSDAYLRFLTHDLKPFIDAQYRTLPDAAHTFIMGSSRGGLISLYAVNEYPRVFGGAGCLSTHWSAGEMLMMAGLAAGLPTPGRHKFYFDYGTVGLDAAYAPFQRAFDARLRVAGYVEGRDFVTHVFPGADHNEAAWRARLHLPLTFLLASNS